MSEEFNVAADLRITLEDASKMDSVKEGLGKIAKVQSATVEELAFGIKALKVTLLLNDDKGGMDEIEEKIRSLDGVSQVETENVTRI